MSRTIADGLSNKATATTQEAEDATAGKYPDAAAVHAAFNQYGLGTDGSGARDRPTDVNAILESGVYPVSGGGINLPDAVPGHLYVQTWDGDTDPRTQIFQSLVDGRMWIRGKSSGGAFTPWAEIFHTENSNAFTDADENKLDGIEAGAEVNVGTNLSASSTATDITIESSTGNNTAVAQASASVAGVMSAADKVQVDAIGTNAERDILIQTTEPTSGQGNNGDVCYVYTP